MIQYQESFDGFTGVRTPETQTEVFSAKTLAERICCYSTEELQWLYINAFVDTAHSISQFRESWLDRDTLVALVTVVLALDAKSPTALGPHPANLNADFLNPYEAAVRCVVRLNELDKSDKSLVSSLASQLSNKLYANKARIRVEYLADLFELHQDANLFAALSDKELQDLASMVGNDIGHFHAAAIDPYVSMRLLLAETSDFCQLARVAISFERQEQLKRMLKLLEYAPAKTPSGAAGLLFGSVYALGDRWPSNEPGSLRNLTVFVTSGQNVAQVIQECGADSRCNFENATMQHALVRVANLCCTEGLINGFSASGSLPASLFRAWANNKNQVPKVQDGNQVIAASLKKLDASDEISVTACLLLSSFEGTLDELMAQSEAICSARN